MQPATPAQEPSADELIDALGGTVATATICEVTPQAVTQWRRAGIPHPRLMYLRVRFPHLFDGAGAAGGSAEAARAA